MISESNKKMLYLVVWVMAVYVLLATLALLMIKNKVSIDQKNQWNLGVTVFSVMLIHISFSFKIVGPTELGAVLLFGRPLYTVKSGLVFVPFIICQIAKETSLVIKQQFPAEPELVDKTGDDAKPVKFGFVKPIRVTTASGSMLADKSKIKDYEDDALNEMLTLEPSVVVRFQIQKNHFISFLTNIGSVEHAISQMRDTVDAVLNIEFPKRTPALIILEKESINEALKTAIEDLVCEKKELDSDSKEKESINEALKTAIEDLVCEKKELDSDSKEKERWGIDIINVQLVDVGLGKTINERIESVPDSKLKAKATIRDAQAAKDSRVLSGQGEKEYETDKGAGVASARLAFLEAETKGLQGIADVAKTEAGKLAVLTKATEQGLKGSQYSIIPDGAGSIIAGIMETLKKTGSRDTSKEEDANDYKTSPLLKKSRVGKNADAGKENKEGKK